MSNTALYRVVDVKELDLAIEHANKHLIKTYKRIRKCFLDNSAIDYSAIDYRAK